MLKKIEGFIFRRLSHNSTKKEDSKIYSKSAIILASTTTIIGFILIFYGDKIIEGIKDISPVQITGVIFVYAGAAYYALSYLHSSYLEGNRGVFWLAIITPLILLLNIGSFYFLELANKSGYNVDLFVIIFLLLTLFSAFIFVVIIIDMIRLGYIKRIINLLIKFKD